MYITSATALAASRLSKFMSHVTRWNPDLPTSGQHAVSTRSAHGQHAASMRSADG